MRVKKKGKTSILPAKIVGVALIVFALFASLLSETLFADEAPPQPETPDEAPDKAPDKAPDETPDEGFRSGVKVCVVPLHGPIFEKMVLYIKRCAKVAKDNEVEYFILSINTPGGAVSAMKEIGNDLIELNKAGITTVAFVEEDAASAGAYITMACDKIIMAKGSQVGSAALILTSPTGEIVELSKEIQEKFVSHAQGTFRAMAKQKGRNPDLAEAMVDQRIWIFWATIEDKDGKTTTRIITKEEKDKIEAAVKAASESGLEPQQRIVKEEKIVNDSELVNLDYEEAVEYGFADTIVVDGIEGVYKYLKLSDPEVIMVEETIEEGLFGILNSPLLRMLLMVVGIGGIFMEIKTPGFGVPGIVGGGAFLLLLLISSIIGTANIWEVVLVFTGIVLLAMEIFVIPGFGVAGIAGILCIIVGILLSFLPFTIPQTDWAWDYLFDRVRDMVVGFAGAVVLIIILIRFLPSTPVFRKLTLATAVGVEEGFIAANTAQKALLGETGTTITKLRPVGKAEFYGEQYQVVADGDFIEAGCKIEVISVNGNSITVRKVN